MKYIIGIDLGGTKTKTGLVPIDGYEILDDMCVDTNVSSGLEIVINTIAETVKTLLTRNGISREEVLGVGLGCPGLIEAETGRVIYSNNFAWSNVPIKNLLEQVIGLPVHVENDANCAVLGEIAAGRAKGCRDVVLLTLGTGVGSGIVVRGKLLSGTGCGGVAGHMTIVAGGKRCTCGKKGCMEAYVSATALIKKTKYIMARNPFSALWKVCEGSLEAANGETAFIAAKQMDPCAKKIIDEYLYFLGSGIGSLISIFRPEKILLSGGICNEGDWILDRLEQSVRKHSFAAQYLEIPRVEIAGLKNRAGLIGAASLVNYWRAQK